MFSQEYLYYTNRVIAVFTHRNWTIHGLSP